MQAPTQEQAGTLTAIAAVIFGAWVRLIIPWQAGFPVNDGGLFYVMVRQVQANGLRIPPYVHYNGLSIPFAYPPLGFYVGAFAADLFRLDPTVILQWFPAVVLVGTLPAFYGLAKAVLGTSFRAGIATLMLAFTPRAITWQIMGGGLTRSLGYLFLLLALASIYGTFTSYSRKRLALSILFSSLLVLSHPEAALQGLGAATLFWVLKGRNRRASLHAMGIGAGTLILTAVWWLPTVLSFGPGTLLSASQTGLHGIYMLLVPFLMNFVDEPLMTLVAVFGVIGFALESSRRRAFIPLWFLATFVIEPRSAPTYATIPLALLAGVALTEIILPGLASIRPGTSITPSANIMHGTSVLVFFGFIVVYMLGSSSLFGAQMAGTTLTPGTREAFAWLRDNTPNGSRFLVLTGTDEVFCDPAQEWFPALTGRISQSTIQGREWLQGKHFMAFAVASQAYQDCVLSNQPLSCVQKLSSSPQNTLGFDYIYVATSRPTLQACRATGTSREAGRLIDELQASARYQKVYESEQAAVFVKR